MNKQTIRDIDVVAKHVLVRAALNVPIENGVVGDRLRLESSLPTIKYLVENHAMVVLLSHHSKEGTSLAPVALVMSELLGQEVKFGGDALGPEAKPMVAAMQPGNVIMFENLRFHPEEEANDPAFAKTLADLGQIYIDDDFTTMHRPHASIVGIPSILPGVAGLLVEREVDTITHAMEAPTRPLVVIIGGAKISTKIEIMKRMVANANAILVGGAMANTFLAAQDKPVGKSLYEPAQFDLAKSVIAQASQSGVKLLLPIDVVVSKSVDAASHQRTCLVSEVAEDDIIVDVGPQTIQQLTPILAEKGTVIWNGPVGITEVADFRVGSEGLAEAIIASGATSLIGGGDTAAFVDEAELHDKFSFVSTGGGASLELMSGKPLPGLEALQDK